MILSATDRRVLAALSEACGSPTGQIAKVARPQVVAMQWDNKAAVRSRETRAILLRLERAGLVRQWSMVPPIVWWRTPAGTAAMNEGNG